MPFLPSEAYCGVRKTNLTVRFACYLLIELMRDVSPGLDQDALTCLLEFILAVRHFFWQGNVLSCSANIDD